MNKKENNAVRKQWIVAVHEASKQYDKAILFLSSGAIALSLAFIDKIFGSRPLNVAQLILWAWGFFILSLLANLVSFLTSQKGYIENIEQLDSGKEPNKFWNLFTWWLNIAALILFILGTIFLCWFSYMNFI